MLASMKAIETTDTAPSSASRESQDRSAARKRSQATSPAQRDAYLRQWEDSGLSAGAFAAKRPINAQSLYRWRAAERSAKVSGAPFREVILIRHENKLDIAFLNRRRRMI